MADQTYDVLVIGASLGGVAAALRAAEMGVSVALIDPTDWVGGQFTSQGVCKPDENKYIETASSTASYRSFHHLSRLWYRNNARLSAIGQSQPLFFAGGPYNASQPLFAVEPKLGHTILSGLLQASPSVHWRPNTTLDSVTMSGDAIASVTTTGADGTQTTYAATYVLDATDLGDVLPLALQSDEWVIGAESRSQTGEDGAYAPDQPMPQWIQPITFVFAIEHRPGGDYTIPEPPNYAAHKAEQRYGITDGDISSMFGSGDTMFGYRQYIDSRNFDDPNYQYDQTTINTGSNDYQGATIPSGDPATDAQTIAAAREATLGYLYWLQTECPRNDGSGNSGFPELMPCTTAFGTGDGIAPAPYIREARRIKALKTIVEGEIRKTGSGPRAQLYPDSCGVGMYAYMDGHGIRGTNPPMAEFQIPTWPVQIPMRALIPQRVTNLLAACKNIGTTHLTNGLYRLHPIEWNIGESAAALAAFCIQQGTTPHDVAGDPHRTRAYQRTLLANGIPLYWWTDVQYGDPLWEAVQMAGATMIVTSDDGGTSLGFDPNGALSDDSRNAIEAKVGRQLPAGDLTRGQTALWLYNAGLT